MRELETVEMAKVDSYDFYVPIAVVFIGNFLFFFWCQWK